MSLSRALAVWMTAILLTACGFQPIHGGAKGPETRAELASVRIEPIEERIGQMLRNHLLDKMNPFGAPVEAAYRLRIKLSESKQELGIRRTEIATRANLLLSASYQLVRSSDEKTVTGGSSNIAASYNILTSDYATLAAEADARERAVRELSDDITQRVAAFFRQQAQARP